MQRRTLFAPYVALLVFGAIAAHLASELSGMGRAAEPIVLAPRHLYLALCALLAAAFVVRYAVAMLRSASGPMDLRRRLRLGLASLPFRGEGWRFIALTAALQAAGGLATEFSEECPLCGHDLAAGLLGAAFIAVLFAWLTRTLTHALPDVAAAIVALFHLGRERSRPPQRMPRDARAPRAALASYPRTRFSRPPPLQA